nr:putative reverse transcriptase domain-containing protein [Tanacetum cinerariifolium]
MIKKSIDVASAAERARHGNAGNDARGSGLVRGQDAAPAVRKYTFAGFMKCNPTAFHGHALTWWNAKVATMGLETVNQMPWTEMKQLMTAEFCKIEDGLTDNIEGEVTSSKPANLNEVVHMAYKLLEPKSQAKDERILEGKKRKWESFQSGNISVMVTTPTDEKVSFGSLPLCERCFARHVGLFTIKCYKCGKIGQKARYYKEKNVTTGENALPIPTCYDCGEQGHIGTDAQRNSSKRKLEKSFVDTRFSSMLNIDPVKIGASYGVKLADGRVVSTNTVLKGCTLNLVNHIFEINLMPIELGTFDVIIGMDWLVKHDAVIVCGKKVVRIPYGNKMLIVESDKAYVAKKKSKEKRLEDVRVICNFPEVFPEELPGLPPSRQVEFQIDLVLGAVPVARAPYRLAPSEMRELSVQLQELLEKGFIRSSSSLWGALVLFMKKKDGSFRNLMNQVCKPYLDKFVIVFIDDILVYSKDEEEYGKHSKIILELLKKERLYAKISKCDFWRDLVQILGHPFYIKILEIASGSVRDEFRCEYRLPPQTDGQSEGTIQMLEDMLRACVIDFRSSWDRHLPLVEFSYNNCYHASIKAAPYEALYGRKCRSPVCWNRRTKPLEFEVSDMVLLKVSPWKGVVRFGKRGKLSPRYIRPFRIIDRVGHVAYTLELPEELKGIHSTFHVLNLKKCLEEGDIVVSMDEIQLDDKLHIIEEQVEIVDKEVKRLKQSRIHIVKVRWNSQRGPEFT